MSYTSHIAPRLTLAFVAIALVTTAACADERAPTSPVADRSTRVSGSLAGAQGPETNGIKVPDAKPTDQVGFTKIDYIESAITAVPAGQSIQGMALCPVGSLATGGGFRLNGYSGSTPVPTYSRLIVIGPQYGWSVVIDNTAAGAAATSLIVNAVCVH